MRNRIVKWTAIVLIVVAMVLVVFYAWPTSNSKVLKVATADGGSISIVEHHFQPGRVRYELYTPRWIRLLPGSLRSRLNVSSTVAIAAFPTNSPGLSVAFWPRLKEGHTGLRLIVSDEHGNEYDEAVHDMGWNRFWVKEIKAFPRRGKELRLRVAEQANVFPELIIPNPDPGPHPVWEADPLPVTSTSGNLEVKLISFRALHTGQSTYTGPGLSPKTELTFQVVEDGKTTSHWQPVSLFFSDATGNRWQPSRYSEWSKVEGDDIRSTLSGALWAGEEAWKVEVDFRKTGGFAEGELVRLEQIPIAGPQVIYEPGLTAAIDGTTVEVFAVIGKEVAWERIYQWNSDRTRDAMTVLINGNLIADGYRLEFVKAFDDRGQDLELVGKMGQASQISKAQFVPYSLNFKPAAEAKSITILVGVTRSKSFQFLAKPEQVAVKDVVPSKPE